jgi:hypothetical protein
MFTLRAREFASSILGALIWATPTIPATAQQNASAIERWRVIDDGKAREVKFTVDDPDAFYEPWTAMQRYARVQRPLREEICAENNEHLFDYHIPVADKPDF